MEHLLDRCSTSLAASNGLATKRAAAQAHGLVGHRVEARYHDGRWQRRSEVASQPDQELEAVHPRHRNISQNQIRPLLADRAQPLAAVGCDPHAMTCRLERQAEAARGCLRYRR